MMTPDKDFGKAVTEKILMFKPSRGGNPPEVMGPKEVCQKFGLHRTEQIIDYLGLMGDAVDNIPGVPGVGAKTASKLLLEFGSMNGIYEKIDKVKGKLAENLACHCARWSKAPRRHHFGQRRNLQDASRR